MGKTVEYQGYTLQSIPHYEAEREKWRLRIVVSAENSPDVRPREFSSEILCSTEQEADIHGITFGEADRPVRSGYEDDGSSGGAASPCAIPYHVFGFQKTGGDRHHA